MDIGASPEPPGAVGALGSLLGVGTSPVRSKTSEPSSQLSVNLEPDATTRVWLPDISFESHASCFIRSGAQAISVIARPFVTRMSSVNVAVPAISPRFHLGQHDAQ